MAILSFNFFHLWITHRCPNCMRLMHDPGLSLTTGPRHESTNGCYQKLARNNTACLGVTSIHLSDTTNVAADGVVHEPWNGVAYAKCKGVSGATARVWYIQHRYLVMMATEQDLSLALSGNRWQKLMPVSRFVGLRWSSCLEKINPNDR
jgi:hypothetical protein